MSLRETKMTNWSSRGMLDVFQIWPPIVEPFLSLCQISATHWSSGRHKQRSESELCRFFLEICVCTNSVLFRRCLLLLCKKPYISQNKHFFLWHSCATNTWWKNVLKVSIIWRCIPLIHVYHLVDGLLVCQANLNSTMTLSDNTFSQVYQQTL